MLRHTFRQASVHTHRHPLSRAWRVKHDSGTETSNWTSESRTMVRYPSRTRSSTTISSGTRAPAHGKVIEEGEALDHLVPLIVVVDLPRRQALLFHLDQHPAVGRRRAGLGVNANVSASRRLSDGRGVILLQVSARRCRCSSRPIRKRRCSGR